MPDVTTGWKLKKLRSPNIKNHLTLTYLILLFSECGRGPHLLTIEFEPTTMDPVEYKSSKTGEKTRHWAWIHKTTGKVVKHFLTQSGHSYDTGTLSSYLKRLRRQDGPAYKRAQHIPCCRAKLCLEL